MRRLRVLFVAPVPNFKGGAEQSLMDLLTNPAVDPFLAVPAGDRSAHEQMTSAFLGTLSTSVRLVAFVDHFDWMTGSVSSGASSERHSNSIRSRAGAKPN